MIKGMAFGGKKKDKGEKAGHIAGGTGGAGEETYGQNDDLSTELIKALNKEMGTRVAYNLATDESPTHIKRWISTGSLLLDYAISNRRGGGYPEGRIIEIAGMPSTGKTHLACATGCNVQKMGGLVVYAETENAVMPSHLEDLGLDIGRRFVYADPACTEDLFKVAEETITKTRAAVERKGMPILFVWDSVAATSPKAELDGDYDQNTIGLQARTISKCMRKMTGIVGAGNVTFLCLNQLRTKIGVMFGDPLTTPGGNAIPFHASVRIRLGSGAKILNKDKEQIGIKVIASLVKNKVARPGRKVEFEIHFGRGIVEHEQVLDVLRAHCKRHGDVVRGDKLLSLTGDSAWKTLSVANKATGEVLLEKKFQISGFAELMRDEVHGPIIHELLDGVMVIDSSRASEADSETSESASDDVDAGSDE